MSSIKCLNAAVIGLGVGERHIQGYLSDPRCRVIALSDTDPQKLQDVSKRFPVNITTTIPDEILTNPSIDVVSIASYDNAHCDQILKAIQYNKHVFVEKPLCLTQNEYLKISNALLLKPNLHISSNLILRKSARFIELRKKVHSGNLGKISYVEGDYDYGRLHKLLQGWRSEIPYYSVTLGGGIHIIDLMMWITGLRVTEVVAYGGKTATKGTSFIHPDLSVALLKFENGLIGKIASNFGSVTPHHHKLAIYGTEGTFIQSHASALYMYSRDPNVAPNYVNDKYPGTEKGDMIPSFIKAILDGAQSEVTKKDVFDGMAVGLAIEKSLDSGIPEQVSYINF